MSRDRNESEGGNRMHMLEKHNFKIHICIRRRSKNGQESVKILHEVDIPFAAQNKQRYFIRLGGVGEEHILNGIKKCLQTVQTRTSSLDKTHHHRQMRDSLGCFRRLLKTMTTVIKQYIPSCHLQDSPPPICMSDIVSKITYAN